MRRQADDGNGLWGSAPKGRGAHPSQMVAYDRQVVVLLRADPLRHRDIAGAGSLAPLGGKERAGTLSLRAAPGVLRGAGPDRDGADLDDAARHGATVGGHGISRGLRGADPAAGLR